MTSNARSAFVLAILGVACTNLDNVPLEQIGQPPSGEDLTEYELADTVLPGQSGSLVVAEVSATLAASASDYLFLAGGDVHAVEAIAKPAPPRTIGSVYINRTRTDGSTVSRDFYELDFLRLGGGHLTDVVADGDGRLWFAVMRNGSASLVAVDPVADTIVRTVAGPALGRDYEDPRDRVTLAYDSGKIYAAYHTKLIEIDAASGAPGRDLSILLLDAFGEGRNFTTTSIAASGGRLIARTDIGVADGVLIDLASGTALGRVAGLPQGDLAGDQTSFAGFSSAGAVVRFTLSPPVPELAVDRVVSFPLGNPRAVAAARGLLWVFFSPGNGPIMIGYHPGTLVPIDVIHFDEPSASKLVNRGFNNLWPYTMAAIGNDFFVAAASNGDRDSTLLQVDYATGTVVGQVTVPGTVVSGLCSDLDGTMWATRSSIKNWVVLDWYQPSFFEIDSTTGAAVGPGTAATFEGRDSATVFCFERRVYMTTETTRLFSSAATGNQPELRLAAPIETASADTVVEGGFVFLLDRERGILIRTIPP